MESRHANTSTRTGPVVASRCFPFCFLGLGMCAISRWVRKIWTSFASSRARIISRTKLCDTGGEFGTLRGNKDVTRENE